MIFHTGQILYKFSLKNFLGEGSFGEVWLANDETTNREFAIKILHQNFTIDDRLKEARTGGNLCHPNVIQIHSAEIIDIDDGMICVVIAMPYMVSGDITKKCNSEGYIHLPEVLRIMVDVLRGLEYLHANGYVHNDIKPQNILVGDQGQALLSDYGITAKGDSKHGITTSASYRIHTAPEVRDTSLITLRTDIFQLGLTMFRLLEGIGTLRSYFNELGEEAYNARIDSNSLITDKQFSPKTPTKVRSIVKKSISADPSERYNSAMEMKRDIEKLSFPGYWTVDTNGKTVGICRNWQFQYETNCISVGKYYIKTTRVNMNTGKVYNVSKYSRNNITRSECTKLKHKLMRDVVSGKCF